jgi:hypothetical protein
MYAHFLQNIHFHKNFCIIKQAFIKRYTLIFNTFNYLTIIFAYLSIMAILNSTCYLPAKKNLIRYVSYVGV